MCRGLDSAQDRTGGVSVWCLRSQILGMLQPVFASRANPNLEKKCLRPGELCTWTPIFIWQVFERTSKAIQLLPCSSLVQIQANGALLNLWQPKIWLTLSPSLLDSTLEPGLDSSALLTSLPSFLILHPLGSGENLDPEIPSEQPQELCTCINTINDPIPASFTWIHPLCTGLFQAQTTLRRCLVWLLEKQNPTHTFL